LKINAFSGNYSLRHYKLTGAEPRVLAIVSSTQNEMFIYIPHGDIVMSLVHSVPPWYSMDTIKCLWNDQKIHIRRVFLQKASK